MYMSRWSLCCTPALQHCSHLYSNKIYLQKKNLRVPIVAQWKQIRLVTTRFRVPSLALNSGLRILPCHELWCRWQMWLGSHVVMAVVLAGSCSCNWTPSLGNSIYLRCGPKKWKKKFCDWIR